MLAAAPERSCTDFHGVGGLTMPTLSHHLRVLREAGLTRTRIDGRRRYVSLRRTHEPPRSARAGEPRRQRQTAADGADRPGSHG
jgi:DNA-binding transcriptional ArsR family regulator